MFLLVRICLSQEGSCHPLKSEKYLVLQLSVFASISPMPIWWQKSCHFSCNLLSIKWQAFTLIYSIHIFLISIFMTSFMLNSGIIQACSSSAPLTCQKYFIKLCTRNRFHHLSFTVFLGTKGLSFIFDGFLPNILKQFWIVFFPSYCY